MKIRVLELGEQVAAGYCGRLYMQWGADVVRIDTPQAGDRECDTALDTYLHAGKRRVGLDVGTSAGRDLLSRLAARCELLVTDMAPAALDKLDWLSLGEAHHPSVKVSITPFGLSGPYRDWQAHGPVILAMGGYTTLMGDPDRAPLTLPGHYVEYQAAQYAYVASLSAFIQQRQTPAATHPAPERQIVEVSLLETVLSLSQMTTVMWTYKGVMRCRHGNDWQNTHPLTLYPCKDGWFAVAAVPTFWEAFTEMIRRPGLKTDARFSTNDQRLANRRELDAIVKDAVADLTMAELLERGQRQCRVPVGTMSDMAELLKDPHLDARQFWQVLVDASGRTLTTPGPAFHYRELAPLPDLVVSAPGSGDPVAILEEMRHG